MKGILKGKNIKVPAKASMWYVGASVLTKATGLLFTPIFTRILTGEEYGAYSLYMSYLGFFSLICAAGFSAGVIYKGFQDFSTKKEVFLSASLGFSVCFSSTIPRYPHTQPRFRAGSFGFLLRHWQERKYRFCFSWQALRLYLPP